MSVLLAYSITSRLLAFAMALQAIELFSFSRKPEIQFLFRPRLNLRLMAGLEIIICLGLAISPSVWPLAALFVLQAVICSQFRGSLNGGSDAMTIVVLTGLVISSLGAPLMRWGLLYIAVHLLISYGRAGLSKLKVREWREGRALPEFMRQSFYRDIRERGSWLATKPSLSRLLCWLAIGFEILLFFSPFLRPGLGLLFGLAVAFHLSVFLLFGLNRFFWIWLAAWPSVFYFASLGASFTRN